MDIKLPGGFTITVSRDSRPKKEKPECGQCHKKFGFFETKHQCRFCATLRCGKCIKMIPWMEYMAKPLNIGWGKVCSVCWDKKVKPAIDVYTLTEKGGFQNVDIYPATYRGKVPLVNGSRKPEIETMWFREKSEAEKSLKFTATALKSDVVVEVVWTKGTDSESGSGKGTHYYTTWSAKGVPAALSRSSHQKVPG